MINIEKLFGEYSFLVYFTIQEHLQNLFVMCLVHYSFMFMEIGIIGGGISGISTAIHLAERIGASNSFSQSEELVNITLLEAKNNLGGRASSIFDQKSGDLIDNGQHLMIGAYTNFFHLLTKLGTLKYLSNNNSQISYLVDGEYYDLNKKWGKIAKLFNLNLMLDLLHFDLLTTSDKISISKLALSIKYFTSYNKYQIASKSEFHLEKVVNFLKFYKQSEKVITLFWEPLCVATLNTSITDASTKVFLNILTDGFLKNNKNAEMFFSQVGLSDLLTPTLEQNIVQNISNNKVKLNLKTNTLVKNISIINKKIEVGYNSEEKQEFDYIVSATNKESFQKIFSQYFNQDANDILQKITYSPILSIYLWFDIEIFCKPVSAITNSPIQWIFNKNLINQSPSKFAKGFYCVTISTANKLTVFDNNEKNSPTLNLIQKSNNEIIKFILSEINRIVPKNLKEKIGNVEEHLLHFRIIKENQATLFLNSETQKLRPSPQFQFFNSSLLNQLVFVTGDWIKNNYPSTIESASINGFETANNVFHRIKHFT